MVTRRQQQLTDRQHRVLRYLVEEYVDTGKAVGSRTLTDQYPLDVSPATVRNEMAVLEDLGLVEHPHRSAGSIPTDLGFRLYVERYAASSRLPTSDQITIRHQFRQVETRLEGWLQLAASVLAEVSGNLSLVTSPRNREARLRHFELLSLQPRLALLILVTQDSAVTQSMIHFEVPVEQEDLSAVADRLNNLFANHTGAAIHHWIDELDGLDRDVGEQLMRALSGNDTWQRTDIRHEGLEHMVRQPEFVGDSDMHSIFSLIRGGALVSLLLPQIDRSGDVQIFIGRENDSDVLTPYGVVMATYGVDEELTGLLGIIGPRRMHYDRSISSVRYMADLMSDLMSDLYYLE